MSDLLNEVDQDYLSTLPVQQQEQLKIIISKMDTKNIQSVVEFGKEIQIKLYHFSNELSDEIHNSDTLNIGQILAQLLTKVNQFDVDDVLGRGKGIFAKFLPPKRPSQKLISQYQKMGIEVDYISTRLEAESKLLEKEINILEKMYEMNKEYYSTISMYIVAGKQKISSIKINELPTLKKKLSDANPIEKELLNDLQRYVNLLDKRIYDLELSRQISIQKAPQIRMIQENHQILLEKIQSSILNTIPLWKEQFILGLTLERQNKAIQVQRQVTDTTNDLLLDTSKKIYSSVSNGHKDGKIELDNLQNSMSHLLGTINDVMKIQETSREQYQLVEQTILKMDRQLKESIENT